MKGTLRCCCCLLYMIWYGFLTRYKMFRFTERRREKAAIEFAREMLAVKDEEVKDKVVSSWGP